MFTYKSMTRTLSYLVIEFTFPFPDNLLLTIAEFTSSWIISLQLTVI